MEVTAIQELIMQIAEKKEGEYEALLEPLYEKINKAEIIYFAYNKATGYPHIDDDGCIWIFSAQAYADMALDYYLQRRIPLQIRPVEQKGLVPMFARLYTWGMEKIRVDNGQYTIVIERGRLLPPPDWKNTPQEKIPVTNPAFAKCMLHFFQNLRSGIPGEMQKDYLHKLEDGMLHELLEARFIVPMKMQSPQRAPSDAEGQNMIPQGNTMIFANLCDNQENTNWLPAFTDWEEFTKIYDKSQWNGSIMAYDDLLSVAGIRGIVINPAGVNFRITMEHKGTIELFRREQKEEQKIQEDTPPVLAEAPLPPVSSEKPREFAAVEEAQPVTIEPQKAQCSEKYAIEDLIPSFRDTYPDQMIEAMRSYMKSVKDIRKGYIASAQGKQGELVYVIVVDFLGEEERIFGELSRLTEPYLDGIGICFHGADTQGLEMVKNTKPFYKKGLFR